MMFNILIVFLIIAMFCVGGLWIFSEFDPSNKPSKSSLIITVILFIAIVVLLFLK